MIIDKKEWQHQASVWIRQKKKHTKLMYAHFILTIPLLIWMWKLPDGVELTWVGSVILNGSFLFAVLVIISNFQLEKQRKALVSSHQMLDMLQEPTDQWGKTNGERKSGEDRSISATGTGAETEN